MTGATQNRRRILITELIRHLLQFISAQALARPVPDVETADYSIGFRFGLHAEVDFVASVLSAVKQDANPFQRGLRIDDYGATLWHLSKRINGVEHGKKPFPRRLQAATLSDHGCNRVEVAVSPRRNLNAKSHAFSGAAS